jgi:hypothetical protein
MIGYTLRTMIVPAHLVATVKAMAASFPSTAGMWTVPLSASGKEPPTHYISTGGIAADLAAILPVSAWEKNPDGTWTRTAHLPGMAAAVAAQAGVPAAAVQAVFDACDITAAEAQPSLDRLGLRIMAVASGDTA